MLRLIAINFSPFLSVVFHFSLWVLWKRSHFSLSFESSESPGNYVQNLTWAAISNMLKIVLYERVMEILLLMEGEQCRLMWTSSYTPVSRRGRIMWLGMQGWWVGIHTGFYTITLVLYIFTELGHMIPLWKGTNPIYFGVITIIPFDNLYRRAYFVMHTFLVF